MSENAESAKHQSLKKSVQDNVTKLAGELIDLSHRVHDNPETAFEEAQASAWVADIMERSGFSVERGAGGVDTAVRASFGSGAFNVGICAEYDALPNIGHACGHNIICASGVGAALALAPLANELDITVTLLGTPAEEGRAGKVHMMRGGAFDGIHAAAMVHPARIERVVMPTLAVSVIDYEFFGKSAHAAAAPDRGINAASAMALAQAGVGMLREQLRSTDRVHGIVQFGGDAPNVVPERTKGRWYVRAADATRMFELVERVNDVFKGAAMMMGCRLEYRRSTPPLTEIKSESKMAGFWVANATALGRDVPEVTSADGPASTDMGNVSYAIPSIHPLIAIDSGDANIHEADFAKAAVNESADETVLFGAQGLAMTVVDIAFDTEFRNALKPFRVADVSAADAAVYLTPADDAATSWP